MKNRLAITQIHQNKKNSSFNFHNTDNLKGDIDQRIKQVEKLNVPYNTKIDIINQLEEDKQLIPEFYEAKVNRDINENDIFIRYITSPRFKNNKVKVKTVLKYYPQYLNAKNGRNSHTF